MSPTTSPASARARATGLAASVRAMLLVRLAAVPWAVVQVLVHQHPPYPAGMREAALAVVGALAAGNVVLAVAARGTPSPRRVRSAAVAGLVLDVAVTAAFVWLHTFEHAAALWAVLFIPPLEGAILFALPGALATWAVTAAAYALREMWGSGHYGYPFSWNSVSFRMGVGFFIALVVGVMARNLRRERSELASALAGVAQSEHRLAEAQRVAGIGSWDWDVERDLVSWSEELYRIFGVDAGAPVSYAGFLARVHPEDRDRVDAVVRRAIASGAPFECEHRVVRPDGTVRAVVGRGEVRCDAAGRTTGMFGTALDVTERKRAEIAIERYTHDLEIANRELARAAELKDHFLAVTNHELRTPLTTILGFTRTLLERWDDITAEERREFVGVIEKQGLRLRALVEDLLTLSAVEAGGLQLDLRSVEVAEVVTASVDSAGASPDALSVVCAPGLRVRADFQRLQQILVNLLSNALTYGAAPVTVAAAGGGEWVEISVRDGGTGVPEEFVPHLFEKFAQASRGLARRSKGTGLGLAIVRELARAQGGDAFYDPGAPGACFVIRLPAAPARPSRAPAPRSSEPAPALE